MSLMIDWVTCVIPVRHAHVFSGGYVFHNRHGEIVREGLTSTLVVGSYASSIQIKTNAISDCGLFGTELFIDGNPSKFLQGHNVIGSLDINKLMLLTVQKIFDSYGYVLDELSSRHIATGNYILYRVDINAPYELPSHSDVVSWIKAASVQSKTRHGPPELKKNTLYWGKGSTLWLLKAYSKYTELTNGGKKRALPRELTNTPLLEFAKNKLRIELQLRKELTKIAKRDFRVKYFYAKFLTPAFCLSLFTEYLGRVDMNSNFGQKSYDDLMLPKASRAPFLHWKQRMDLKSIYSTPTLYRHRVIIRKILDIDIFIPYSGYAPVDNVVPLLRPLEARPAKITDNLLQYMVV